MNKNIYTVGQINSYIKGMFAQDFMLHAISVKGEISNCKYHSSGHIYFTLKDQAGAIKAVMFRGNRSGLSFPMKDGDQVIVTGSVEVYERDGVYQMYARTIELAGAGDLYQRYEQLKKELEEMGMFAQEYKQPIPKYIRTLGVVTAPTGAAVQDIRNIASRRNPYVQIILYPAQVQGEGAAQSIVNGIHALEALGVDVMIVGRGGGSIEDLWAFNEEIVARAIFDCSVPIISAVGHETDTTIADWVADMRAPTPSAGAELAVKDIHEIWDSMEHYKTRMNQCLYNQVQMHRAELSHLSSRLLYVSPANRLKEEKKQLGLYDEKIRQVMEATLKDRQHKLAVLASGLEGNSPLKKLSMGYAFAEGPDGRMLSSVKKVKEGDRLTIHVLDGKIPVKVEDKPQELDRD